jgi:hypothetical protein
LHTGAARAAHAEGRRVHHPPPQRFASWLLMVCLCVFVFVYMYVCMCMCMYTLYACAQTACDTVCTHMCSLVLVYACVHVRVRICARACVRQFTCVAQMEGISS